MKRATLAAFLLGLLTFSCEPAFAQPPLDRGGPIATQAPRDASAERVRAGAPCPRCDLFQADFSYQNLDRRDFSGARLRQSDLEVSTADRAIFRGSNMSLANLFGARASQADFSNANLDSANLVGAYLGGARLSGASLRNANLAGADLSDALGLTQTQLNEACGDAATTLPAGMTIPVCRRAA
jgi:uncharacterized protein YjbI with pentapeptide repeats